MVLTVLSGAEGSYAIPKPWNGNNADPYEDINNAILQLQDSYNYNPKQLVLGPKGMSALRKKDLNGNRYIDQVAELFPNGAADIKMSKTLTGTTGLLSDAGPDIAQCYMQEDINLRTFPMTSNEVQDFNIRAKLGIDIHEPHALVQLTGVTT